MSKYITIHIQMSPFPPHIPEFSPLNRKLLCLPKSHLYTLPWFVCCGCGTGAHRGVDVGHGLRHLRHRLCNTPRKLFAAYWLPQELLQRGFQVQLIMSKYQVKPVEFGPSLSEGNQMEVGLVNWRFQLVLNWCFPGPWWFGIRTGCPFHNNHTGSKKSKPTIYDT